MGLDVYFVYESDDKEQFEVKQTACRGLQDLFEFHPDAKDFPGFENSVLYPAFVKDFPKLRDWEPSDFDVDNLTDEEIEEMAEGIEAYVGPTFDAGDLVIWATTWIEIIEGLNDEDRRILLPMTTDGYDWTPMILEDLKSIAIQGQCAQQHGVRMHIEMY